MTEAGLSRRDLLRFGAVGAPLLLANACGWDGGALIEPRLKAISRFNDKVGQALFRSSKLAPEYTVAERSRSMPTYWTADNTPVLDDPAAWRLNVGGLVRTPTLFTREMLEALPSVTYTVKHHCVEGWTAVATWTGVPLATLARLVAPTDRAQYVRFDSFDDGYYNCWDLQSAVHAQTILAYAFNGEPMNAERGAPLRLYSPVKLGYKLTKYLTAVTFTDEKTGGYWEDKGYPWYGGV